MVSFQLKLDYVFNQNSEGGKIARKAQNKEFNITIELFSIIQNFKEKFARI